MSNAVGTQIKEYSATEAGLAALREKYAGRVFDVTTTAGDKEARAARQELVKLRTSLEAKRKEIKGPALAYCQAIDSEARRITAEIKNLEDPIDAQIKAEEQRKAAEKAEKERIERERVAAIQGKIHLISRVAFQSRDDEPEMIEATLADLHAMVIDEDEYQELTAEARAAKEQAEKELTDLLARAQARKEEAARLAAEREELERLRREAEEERARLAAEREAIEQERQAAAAAKAEPRTDEEVQREFNRAMDAEIPNLLAEPEPADKHEAAEREHFGNAFTGTGIYAPPVEESVKVYARQVMDEDPVHELTQALLLGLDDVERAGTPTEHRVPASDALYQGAIGDDIAAKYFADAVRAALAGDPPALVGQMFAAWVGQAMIVYGQILRKAKEEGRLADTKYLPPVKPTRTVGFDFGVKL